MRLLHLHNWALKDILPRLTKIKSQKFDTILVGPIHYFQKDTLNNLSILAKNAQKEGLSCHLEIPLSFFAHLNMYELYFLFNTLEETGINGFYFENITSFIKDKTKEEDFFKAITFLNKPTRTLYAEVNTKDDYLIWKYSTIMHLLGSKFYQDETRNIYYGESASEYYTLSNKKSNEDIAYKYASLVQRYPNTMFFIRPYTTTWESEIIKRSHECILRRDPK